MEKLDVNDVIKTRYIEKNKFPPLPYRRIINERQCVECLFILAKEIGDIADALGQYIGDVMLIEMVLQDDESKYIDYDEVREYIEFKIKRVNFVVTMIHNYLNHGDVGIKNRSDSMPKINSDVAFINDETKDVDTAYDRYNRNRTFDKPDVNKDYGDYAACIRKFNTCIDAWNKRFNVNIPYARLPVHCRG